MSMRRLKKKFKFEAAHHLRHYLGNCHRKHGHSYSFEIEVYGPVETKGPNRGMTVDYHIIGDAGKAVAKELDHFDINKITKSNTTTAEFLSKWIFDKVDSEVPYLWAVTVSETESTNCRYSPAEDCMAEQKVFINPMNKKWGGRQ